MSKEVQIIAWCDNLINHQDRASASFEVAMRIDNVERMLDLCTHCKARADAMLTIMLERGSALTEQQKAKPKRAQKMDYESEHNRTCPWPQCADRAPSKTRQSLGQHLLHEHGSGFTGAREAGYDI